MRPNPFYALSAGSMLFGCWLLGQALQLRPGQTGSLLVLVAVLQLYEGLLVALGAQLVRTRRAPRDGVTVLALESLFLLDATLLAAECVTDDLWVGTAVAFALCLLAIGKLAWARSQAPELLTRPAAAVLVAHAACVLVLPVLAAHLARHQAFGDGVLQGLWWAAAALPFAQRALRDATRAGETSETGAHAAWTWTPAALVLLHLWAIGYIHSLDFRVHLLGPFALAWAVAAWLDGRRSPAVAVGSCGVLLVLGGHMDTILTVAERGIRFAGRLLPRDVVGWGVLSVAVSFALLAAGAWRSLREPSPEP